MPLVPFAGVAVKAAPLHADPVIAVTAGTGLTVIVTVNVEPMHVPAVGVTVYVAVCAVLVGLLRVPVTEAPLPAAPPVIPPETAGAPQVYVVPAGTTPLVLFTGVTENATALHAVPVIAVIAGMGLTVTVLVIGVPAQAVVPGPVGVTVYVTVTAAL